MRFYKRLLSLIILFVVLSVFLMRRSDHGINVDNSAMDLPNERAAAASQIDSLHTKAIVMYQGLDENTTWLDGAEFPSRISKHVYLPESLELSLNYSASISIIKLSRPKGYEAMGYLTYIIDNYDSLPDVSIFLHAHRYGWHNDEILHYDAVEMIKRLSAERVIRERYMNLRCHWVPGCPEHIRPSSPQVDEDKPEEEAMAAVWTDLFPNEPLPDVIGSQCCAQFAVSRDAIKSIPLQQFKYYRDWLAETELDDETSGRVFESLWHKIFTGRNVLCPSMRVCHCDGYGVCFETDEDVVSWYNLRYKERLAREKLQEWDEQERTWSSEMKAFRFDRKNAVFGDEAIELKRDADKWKLQLDQERSKALSAGIDPRIRAQSAGRTWREGDGY